LVACLGVGDGDGGGAGGDWDGDEAVVALVLLVLRVAGGDGDPVEGDAPGGVVAEVEDEDLRDGRVQREVVGGRAGRGVGGGLGVGVGGEPEGGVGVGEGVVVGGDGGVFVGGVGALVGVEESLAGLDGVLVVAGLVEGGIGRVGEGRGDCEGEGCGGDRF